MWFCQTGVDIMLRPSIDWCRQQDALLDCLDLILLVKLVGGVEGLTRRFPRRMVNVP